MKIDRQTDTQLILSYSNWKTPLRWAVLALGFFFFAGSAARNGQPGVFWFFTLLFGLPFTLLALLTAERSQLIIDRSTGQAQLRRRTLRGYQAHSFDLCHVQGTRIARENRRGTPAAKDPDRQIDLFVRSGMDAGRYKLTNAHLDTDLAKAISDRVNAFMRAHRKAQKARTAHDRPVE